MREHWSFQALCAPHNLPAGVSGEWWTEPSRSGDGKAAGWGRSDNQKEAIRICRRCPVQAECLRTSLELEGRDTRAGRHGVWGGLVPAERARLARKTEMRVSA